MLAACGDGDGGDAGGNSTTSVEAFRAEVDAVCAQTASEIKALYAREKPRIRPELARVQAERLVISERAQEDVQAIEPPDDLADDYDEYLAQRERLIDLLRDEQEANAQLDAAAARRLAAQIAELGGDVTQAAGAVGLTVCAGK